MFARWTWRFAITSSQSVDGAAICTSAILEIPFSLVDCGSLLREWAAEAQLFEEDEVLLRARLRLDGRAIIDLGVPYCFLRAAFLVVWVEDLTFRAYGAF
jgi:hypothetical protein